MPEPFSIRMGLRSRKGRTVERYGNPAITAHSVVHISASEANIVTPILPGQVQPEGPGPGGIIHPPPSHPGVPSVGARFVGSADVSVRSVSPQDGVVIFSLVVDWASPLDVAIDITVFDPPAFNLVGG